MRGLQEDPLARLDIAGYARDLRSGRTSALQVTQAYLSRIEALNPVLRAYEHVAYESALASAKAVDQMLKAGSDLGPLMGVPIAVKDVLSVDGMPTRAGSDVDVADLIGGEGPFVQSLRRAGCIILGKTQTVEFAIGSTGTNYLRGTPRNPCDPDVFRLAAGSSSGSAVAVAAALCGLAIGTDTGGSVRGPAAFCGVFGLKFGRDSASRAGVFPMSRSFDSLGLLAASASSAACAWQALTGQAVGRLEARQLRLGLPRQYFFDRLAPEVADCTQRALDALVDAGVQLVDLDFPELLETDAIYTAIARPELVASLGSERFLAMQQQLNPDVAERIADGLEVSSECYLRGLWRQQALQERAHGLFDGLDAWVAPVKQHTPPAFAGSFSSHHAERELSRLCSGPTRPANVLSLCATSQPIDQWGAPLPVGLQLMRPAGSEARLLSVALACETVLGVRRRDDMRPFLSRISKRLR